METAGLPQSIKADLPVNLQLPGQVLPEAEAVEVKSAALEANRQAAQKTT